MPKEEVIELSIEETNKLRAELGLKPLRLDKNDDDDSRKDEVETNTARPNKKDGVGGGDDAEVLELSVDETNKLRETLGLPPLRTGGSSSKKIQDAKLKEKQEAEEEAQAEAKAKLEDDVERGIANTFTEKALGTDESNDVNSWAAKLRQSKGAAVAAAESNKKKKKKKSKKKGGEYGEGDLKGMNVSHAVSELEAGSTTVMTLSDAPILQTKETNPHIVTGLNEDANTPQLENVNLAEKHKQADGLRKKRQLEMGMGRAGGYAGFDDDEFLELGGTGVPSRAARGTAAADGGSGSGNNTNKKPRKGFQIGDDTNNNATSNNGGSDLFAMESGKAISLEPGQADVQASDFMTEQEDLELRGKDKKKKSKRKDKFDKKKKKKDKKERKKHRRRQAEDEEEESEEEASIPVAAKSGKSLLDELEETAEESMSNKKSRKRSRSNDDDEDNEVKKEDGIKKEEEAEAPASNPSAAKLSKSEPKKEDKRAKYDAIMDKGNARTKQAFAPKAKKTDDAVDEEPDDAFLNAALAKARRLKKLRGMNATVAPKRGAEAVVESVQQMPDAAPSSSATGTDAAGGTTSTSGGGISFSVDDTREFTRALRARTEQQSRQQIKVTAKKDKPAVNTITTKEEQPSNKMEVETVKQEEEEDNNNDGTEDVDMTELAKEIKDDDDDDTGGGNLLDGGTGTSVAVGRGLAGVLDLYKQTGDLTRKNAGKEKMRGRAKDQRTYEDYEPIDLKNVVKIDTRYATDKDKEMASREIKLEYRDKTGRLLTRKEAFRDLCYQFHGHGSSKRKEEQRQRQMAQEEAEARLASQQLGGAGTLGALKATQKATGKAFVVHKT